MLNLIISKVEQPEFYSLPTSFELSAQPYTFLIGHWPEIHLVKLDKSSNINKILFLTSDFSKKNNWF